MYALLTVYDSLTHFICTAELQRLKKLPPKGKLHKEQFTLFFNIILLFPVNISPYGKALLAAIMFLLHSLCELALPLTTSIIKLKYKVLEVHLALSFQHSVLKFCLLPLMQSVPNAGQV